MSVKIWNTLKQLILLPQHLHNFLVEMNRLEDSFKYQISFVTDNQREFNIIKGILETQNKLLVEILDKLDEIKRRLK